MQPTTQTQIEPILVSRVEGAKALSISPRSLDYLIASGEIHSRRIGRRVLVAVADLKAYAKSSHPKSIRGTE